jgi:hypothetical protein
MCPDQLWGPHSLLSKGNRRSLPGDKVQPGSNADYPPHLLLRSRMNRSLHGVWRDGLFMTVIYSLTVKQQWDVLRRTLHCTVYYLDRCKLWNKRHTELQVRRNYEMEKGRIFCPFSHVPKDVFILMDCLMTQQQYEMSYRYSSRLWRKAH